MENKIIKVKSTSIENGTSKEGKKWTRVDIFTDEYGKEVKYSFFTTKKDGSSTKAFEYFKAVKSTWDDAFMNGEDVEIEIAFEDVPRTFVGKDGKEHTGHNRNIKAFKGEPLVGQPIGDQNIPENRLYKDEIAPMPDDIGW